jgi:hypothetical protein
MADWWEGTSFIVGYGDSPLTWLRSDGTYSTFNPFESCKVPDGVQYLHRRSSNGNLLIGTGCPNGEWWLYWANPDGTVVKPLLEAPITDLIGVFGDIAWSQDDQYIAFTDTSDKTRLYILNVERALRDPSIQPMQIVISEEELYTILSWQPLP